MIHFLTKFPELKKYDHVFYVASQKHFVKSDYSKVSSELPWHLFGKELENKEPIPNAKALKTYTGEKAPSQLTAVIRPDEVSRGNTKTQKEVYFEKNPQKVTVKDFNFTSKILLGPCTLMI